jgi:hypothetical protein
MNIVEAKELVLELLKRDITTSGLSIDVDVESPDEDPGKFTLAGKTARAIYPRDNYYVNINLKWFEGSEEPPSINLGQFYWYAFAIPRKGKVGSDHYFVCDYKRMRRWVLEFNAPLGKDHRDHHRWRGSIDRLEDEEGRPRAWFRWGDERSPPMASRLVALDNVLEVIGSSALATVQVLYMEFQQAPNDDIASLQTFARRVRRGQRKLRENLLRCFNGKCLVTGTNVESVLEACHIDPHCTSGLNHTDNGLLLRSDIHALFDDDLLCIDPETLSVVVDSSLKDTIYWELNGRQLFDRPSVKEQRYALLRARWQRRQPKTVKAREERKQNERSQAFRRGSQVD